MSTAWPGLSLARTMFGLVGAGVVNVDPQTKEASIDEYNVRKDIVSREVLRHPEFADIVELGRVRDHFLFNIESEGPYTPERLLQAITIMREKISVLRKVADTLFIG
ncbi:hypothetical protein C0995_014792 [Termitomyces sp. Mi166|nr:hypothetical protein C0995_014792 [Termitomyces sp. Mi166\